MKLLSYPVGATGFARPKRFEYRDGEIKWDCLRDGLPHEFEFPADQKTTRVWATSGLFGVD